VLADNVLPHVILGLTVALSYQLLRAASADGDDDEGAARGAATPGPKRKKSGSNKPGRRR